METSSPFERVITYDPYGSQLKYHALETKYKGFSGPVGSGKSLAFCHEALRLAYVNDGCQGLIGAPTYRLLHDATQTAFFEILEENAVPYEFRKGDQVCYLPEPGSEILFRSMDAPERLRGMNLAWFGVDELTYCHQESWKRLEARLRSPKAKERKGFAVWTPHGFDWVYRHFISKEKGGANYGVVLAKPGENKHLPDDFYEALKSSYDERFYKQEVLGEYLNQFSGAVYFNFDRAENVGKLEFNPAYPLCWALDFNIDPMCSVIAQMIDTTTREMTYVGRKSCRINVLDELALPDTRTLQACEVFLKRIEPFLDKGLRHIQIYGDASGSGRHSCSFESDWEIVRAFFKKRTDLHVTYRLSDANPAVRDRVAAVTGMLLDASGERKLFVDPRCKETIQDFEEVPWKRDASGNAIDEINKTAQQRTHCTDALGYLVYRECKIAPRGGPRSQVIL